MSQLISDDEVVAMAISAGVQWRGLLPTVPIETDELSRAALRGSRSFALRGLTDSTVASLHSAVHSGPLVLAFIAAESRPLVPVSSGVGIYPTSTPSDVIVDITLPVGIHEFSTGSRRRGRGVLSGFVAQFQQQGSALGGGYHLILLLSGTADPGSTVLFVRRQTCTVHRCSLGRSNQIEIGPVLGRSDAEAAILAALPDIE